MNYRQLIIRVFQQLRSRDFDLGLRELLDALSLVEAGWEFDSADRLRDDLRLLWCHSPARNDDFDEVWQHALEAEAPPELIERETPPPASEEAKREFRREPPPPAPQPDPAQPESQTVEASVLPAQPFAPSIEEKRGHVTGYGPISREAMAHGWRSLRRPRPDGPFDVLDVEATIDRAARQGFFLDAVFRRRESNHAHLVLLLDQGGSMAPFHRFTRDLVETAQAERHLRQVEVFYFHNHFGDCLHSDPHLVEEIALDGALAEAGAETSLLIVSDAGAARGYRRRERIRATTAMLARLQARTNLIAWLNPMPARRWEGSSAEVIAHLAPMFQMDPDGFSIAIDVARGLSAVQKR